MKNSFETTARENFKIKNEFFEEYSIDFIIRYRLELGRLLNTYSESVESNNNKNVLNEK